MLRPGKHSQLSKEPGMVLAASPWEELPGKPRVQIPRVQLSNLNVTTQVQLSSPQQVLLRVFI